MNRITIPSEFIFVGADVERFGEQIILKLYTKHFDLEMELTDQEALDLAQAILKRVKPERRTDEPTTTPQLHERQV